MQNSLNFNSDAIQITIPFNERPSENQEATEQAKKDRDDARLSLADRREANAKLQTLRQALLDPQA